MNFAGRRFFVYRIFDADGQLLYVGCTNRLSKRWSEHKQARPGMVAAAARCRIQGPYTRDEARELEKHALRTEEPLLGWTPTRHREKCAPDRWIERRMDGLIEQGVDGGTALHKACRDAEEWFPDPYEHEDAYRRSPCGSAQLALAAVS